MYNKSGLICLTLLLLRLELLLRAHSPKLIQFDLHFDEWVVQLFDSIAHICCILNWLWVSQLSSATTKCILTEVFGASLTWTLCNLLLRLLHLRFCNNTKRQRFVCCSLIDLIGCWRLPDSMRDWATVVLIVREVLDASIRESGRRGLVALSEQDHTLA